MFDKPEGELPHPITNSWKDYLDDCSGAKIIENQVHAAHVFSLKYKENIVQWDGYFIDFKNHAKYNAYSIGSNSILIKMDPSESDNFADIVLSIPRSAHNKNNEVVKKLEKGDHVIFKAQIISMGNEFKLHHLKLIDEEGSLVDTGKTEDYDHISVVDTKLP